jgi:hypothetical protein
LFWYVNPSLLLTNRLSVGANGGPIGESAGDAARIAIFLP